jgi:hypothetical protein
MLDIVLDDFDALLYLVPVIFTIVAIALSVIVAVQTRYLKKMYKNADFTDFEMGFCAVDVNPHENA